AREHLGGDGLVGFEGNVLGLKILHVSVEHVDGLETLLAGGLERGNLGLFLENRGLLLENRSLFFENRGVLALDLVLPRETGVPERAETRRGCANEFARGGGQAFGAADFGEVTFAIRDRE